MILERELAWGHAPGWFSTLDTEQQTAILALLKIQADEARARQAAERHRQMQTQARLHAPRRR